MNFTNPNRPFAASAAEAYLPVDIYIGGVEHAILHLLYARFISKFLATTSLWPSGGGPSNKGEPFRKLITQGMVHGKTYSDPTTGRFLKPEEVDLGDRTRPKIRKTGEPATVSWEKMSKSKHNGVDPAECIKKYGADATRAHMLFQAPVTEVLEWNEEKIVGIQRWFGRVWKVVGMCKDMRQSSMPEKTPPLLPNVSDLSEEEADLWHDVQRTILSVTHSLDKTHSLNTVVSDLIKLTNSLAFAFTHLSLPVLYHATSALLRMLAPLAPAFAEECWEALHASHTCPPNTQEQGDRESIFAHPFPTADSLPSYPPSSSSSSRAELTSPLRRTKQTCAVQENGKLRFAVEIACPTEHLLGSADDDGESREALERWVVGELNGTEVGRRWFEAKGWGVEGEGKGERQKRWKRIVVVKGGRTVNFVG